MALIKKCDVCAVVYDPYGHYSSKDLSDPKNQPNGIEIVFIDKKCETVRTIDRLDVCPKCMGIVLNTLLSIGSVQEE